RSCNGVGRSAELFRLSEITLRLVLPSHRAAVILFSSLLFESTDWRAGARDPLTSRSASRADHSRSPCNRARSTTASLPDGPPTPPSLGSGVYSTPSRGTPSPCAERDRRSAAETAIPPRAVNG